MPNEERLAPLPIEQIRAFQDIRRNGPWLVAMAQEIEMLRADAAKQAQEEQPKPKIPPVIPESLRTMTQEQREVYIAAFNGLTGAEAIALAKQAQEEKR